MNQIRLALVTGASGFIGRHLCACLQKQGIHVRALMRHLTDGPWDETVNVDLAAGPLPDGALKDVDTIFHLAGKTHALSETRQDEDECFNVNTNGTRWLLESAEQAGVQRFIFFSTVKSMGEGGDNCLDETMPCEPETAYGKSNYEAERLVLKSGKVPEPVVLRLSMVYGPTTKGNLPRMIQAVNRGRFPPLPETGNKRSMVHVDDVVQAALLAATRPAAAGNTYIVTDGQPYSTREIYEWMCGALKKPPPAWTVPLRLLQVLARMGDGIGRLRNRRFIFDSNALYKLLGSAWYTSEKIQTELGFVPKQNLKDAISDIYTLMDSKC